MLAVKNEPIHSERGVGEGVGAATVARDGRSDCVLSRVGNHWPSGAAVCHGIRWASGGWTGGGRADDAPRASRPADPSRRSGHRPHRGLNVPLYSLIVSIAYAFVWLIAPGVANALTIAFVALLLVPAGWAERERVRKR